jgi:chromosome segregation ATPase
MARGITETDVWQAADALLLEGQRPTIERVRGKIGRGSPNTVAPHLDSWFSHLGGRIQDPGAFSAPPALPDPIQQAAQHFWEVALSLGREACAAQVAQAQADADARIAAAETLQQQAERETERLQAQTQKLVSDLDTRSRALDAERLTHAATRSRFDSVTEQLSQQAAQLESAQAALSQERESARRDIAVADERTLAAERRAGLEIDRERQARARADKRAEQLEAKLETLQSQHQTELLKTVEQSARMSAELQALRAQARDAAAEQAALQGQLKAALQDNQSQQTLRQQAEAQTAAAQRELSIWRQNHTASARPLKKSLRSPAQTASTQGATQAMPTGGRVTK